MSLDQDYLAALSEERAAVIAFVSTGVDHPHKLIHLLDEHDMRLAQRDYRVGESPAEGAQRSRYVARLFRNALLIHRLECAAKMGLLAAPLPGERVLRKK